MSTTAREYRDRMWRKPLRPLCPKAQHEPAPCDCGYVGDWMFRLWREKWPCKAKNCFDCRYGQREGHERIVGHEELCPRCGDVERFDMRGALVESIRNPKFTGSRNEALDEDDPFDLLDEETP